MPYKRKQAIPGPVHFDKLISELPEKRKQIKTHIQFRHNHLESQKKLITRMNSIVFKVQRSW